jgi:HK97 family phage major capsid protein
VKSDSPLEPRIIYRRPLGLQANPGVPRCLAFLDFSAYYVRRVGDVVVELDRSRWFDTDQTGVRAKLRVDGDMADLTAMHSLVMNV